MWWVFAVVSISASNHAVARADEKNQPGQGVVEFDLEDPDTWYFSSNDAGGITSSVTCLTAESVVRYLDMYRVDSELRASILEEYAAYERARHVLEEKWNQHLAGDAFKLLQMLDLELDPPPTVLDLSFPGMDHPKPPVTAASPDDPRRESLRQLQRQVARERRPLIDALDDLNARTINAIHVLVLNATESETLAEASASRLMQEALHDGRWNDVGQHQDAPVDFGRYVVSDEVTEILCKQLERQMGHSPELPMEQLALTTDLHDAMIRFDLDLSRTARSTFLRQLRFASRPNDAAAADPVDSAFRRAGREWATRQRAADTAFKLLQATLSESIGSLDDARHFHLRCDLERLFYAGMGEWHARLHWGERLSDWWTGKGEAPNPAVSAFCDDRRREAAEFRRRSFALVRECGREAGTVVAITDLTFGKRCQLVGLVDSYLETQRGHAESFELLVPAEMHGELRQRFVNFEARFKAVLFECRRAGL